MSFKEIIDNVSNIENLGNTTILKTLEKFNKAIIDFAEEQSGLTNLINVEFVPTANGVTYGDGVVDYLGNLKISLADNIIVYKPCSIKFNIKGSETIVVDVDEFDNALEIHLDNDIVNKINRALLLPLTPPSERQFVMIGTNNSEELVNESDLIREGFISAKLDATLELTDGQYHKLNLVSDFSKGGKFSINDNGDIVIGDGVNAISINLNLQIYISSNTYCHLRVYKNETLIIDSYIQEKGDPYYSMFYAITPVGFWVSPNDILRFEFKSDGLASINPNGRGTFITVKEIK